MPRLPPLYKTHHHHTTTMARGEEPAAVNPFHFWKEKDIEVSTAVFNPPTKSPSSSTVTKTVITKRNQQEHADKLPRKSVETAEQSGSRGSSAAKSSRRPPPPRPYAGLSFLKEQQQLKQQASAAVLGDVNSNRPAAVIGGGGGGPRGAAPLHPPPNNAGIESTNSYKPAIPPPPKTPTRHTALSKTSSNPVMSPSHNAGNSSRGNSKSPSKSPSRSKSTSSASDILSPTSHSKFVPTIQTIRASIGDQLSTSMDDLDLHKLQQAPELSGSSNVLSLAKRIDGTFLSPQIHRRSNPRRGSSGDIKRVNRVSI